MGPRSSLSKHRFFFYKHSSAVMLPGSFPSFLFGKLTVEAIRSSPGYCVTVQYDMSSSSLLGPHHKRLCLLPGWLWSLLCLTLLEGSSQYQAWAALSFFFSHSHPLKDYRTNLYETEAGNSGKTMGLESG